MRRYEDMPPLDRAAGWALLLVCGGYVLFRLLWEAFFIAMYYIGRWLG